MPECPVPVNGKTLRDCNLTAMVPGILSKTAILALLWWIISQGELGGWLLGLPAVALAAVAGLHFGNTSLSRVSLAGLPGFVVLFLRESIRGGFDVARRTLSPRLRVQPGFRDYLTRLNEPLARVLLVNCISLLPGTLTVQLKGNRVELHLLDAAEDPDPGLHRLEQAIARLFGLALETTDV